MFAILSTPGDGDCAIHAIARQSNKPRLPSRVPAMLAPTNVNGPHRGALVSAADRAAVCAYARKQRRDLADLIRNDPPVCVGMLTMADACVILLAQLCFLSFDVGG